MNAKLRIPVLLNLVWWCTASVAAAQSSIARPSISEEFAPIEHLSVETSDGHTAIGVLRKPPGVGPFPAVVILHGGVDTFPVQILENQARDGATMTRFLAAGYVIVIPTYRSRSADLDSPGPTLDVLAIIQQVRDRPEVAGDSIVVYGCSGGADMALQLASETKLAAISGEEPPGVLFTGMFNNETPTRGAKPSVMDAMPLTQDPLKYYTDAIRESTREKIRKIECPIFIAVGDQMFRFGGMEADLSLFVSDILVPELRSAGKSVQVEVYEGQYHCFGMGENLRGKDMYAAMLKLFEDMHAFFGQHLKTQPTPLPDSMIESVPVAAKQR